MLDDHSLRRQREEIMRAHILAISAIGFGIFALGSAVRADISNATVSEQVSASSNGTVPDTESASNLTLPPVPLSVTATSSDGSAQASVSIQTYIGPATSSDTSIGLNLVGSIDTFNGLGPPKSSSGSFIYTFTLGEAEGYSFTGQGTTSLSGPGGTTINLGTFGVLQPGNYMLFSSVTNTLDTSGGSLFSLTVTPEPASLGLIAMAGIALIRCRAKYTRQ
jgi:hypothetical protein